MTEKILFVYEGKKTERNLAKILKYYVSSDILVETSFCGNLYALYDLLNNPEEDFCEDIIPILKSRYDNENLNNYNRNSFGSIYLFFDYDSHDPHFTIEKLHKLISFFDNETEYGKLFISYPMIEAFKHIENLDDKDVFLDCVYCCKEGKKYKNHVHNNQDKRIIECLSTNVYRNEDIANWSKMIDFHCSKGNFIINQNKNFPEELLSQEIILNCQYEKSDNNKGYIYTLSAYPLMLLDYFGCEKLLSKLKC